MDEVSKPMIIYNVTIKINEGLHNAWFRWLQDEHIPSVLATGCFTNAKVLRLLDIDEEEGPTYAIQYLAENRENYDRYIQNFATAMRDESFRKWGNGFIAFRSLMQVVH